VDEVNQVEKKGLDPGSSLPLFARKVIEAEMSLLEGDPVLGETPQKERVWVQLVLESE
jgi:hypothetical protein